MTFMLEMDKLVSDLRKQKLLIAFTISDASMYAKLIRPKDELLSNSVRLFVHIKNDQYNAVMTMNWGDVVQKTFNKSESIFSWICKQLKIEREHYEEA